MGLEKCRLPSDLISSGFPYTPIEETQDVRKLGGSPNDVRGRAASGPVASFQDCGEHSKSKERYAETIQAES